MIQPTTHPITGIYTEIDSALAQYEHIQLNELLALDKIVLLDRIDVKFLLRPQQVFTALQQLTPHYRVLTVQNSRLQQYHTLYFDTANFAFFQQHQRDARPRYKVRYRTYVDSCLSFFELKYKNNKDRTIKSRVPAPRASLDLTAKEHDFLRANLPIDPALLEPKISNSFLRITLVGNDTDERITIDLDVQFDDSDPQSRWPNLVIAEVKQPHFTRQSPFVTQMRLVGAYELGLTKYCIGVALRYQQVRSNNFKPTLLQMAKLSARA